VASCNGKDSVADKSARLRERGHLITTRNVEDIIPVRIEMIQELNTRGPVSWTGVRRRNRSECADVRNGAEVKITVFMSTVGRVAVYA
jgi:hypothetical protein